MHHSRPQFAFGKEQLTASKALAICRGNLQGILDNETRARVRASRDIVQQIVHSEQVVYGINTGFGPLCNEKIPESDTQLLQYNLLISHSVGVGDPIPPEIAKLMLVLKVHALAKGHSGVQESTLDRILWHIEQDIIPVVPAQGSVGASGDLAPLAHLFLPLLGLGKVYVNEKMVDSQEALADAGLAAIQLGAKEGLGLINGTQFIAAYAVKVLADLHNCLSQADIIAALMIEGLLGSAAPFHPDLHQLRAYPANQHVAARIATLLKDSEIGHSHIDCERVQDPYSMRCIPQVHGASRTAWKHLKDCLSVELESVTDNPIIVHRDLIISGGNFHGQPLALPLDYACLAASELGNISDRRIYLSLTGMADDTPRLLMRETGVNSAFMILQYTSAALVSENKGLCFPASADSIPTSLGQEDHVSMGSISGRKAWQVVQNLEKILAIELLCAAQAFDFRKPLKSSHMLDAVHDLVRSQISHADRDRLFAHDIEKAIEIIQSGEILTQVEETAQDYDCQIETNFEALFEHY